MNPLIFYRTSQRRDSVLMLLCLGVFSAMMIRRAWIAEDAYFTFRSVDNFLHGYGLRWNIAERVQGFTHPLWAGIWGIAYALTGEHFFTTLILSIALSVSAVYLVLRESSGSAAVMCLMTLSFTLSPSFLDYSTSGLENALSHFLFALFFVSQSQCEKKNCPLTSAVIFGLILLNRLDCMFLLLPWLAYETYGLFRSSPRQGWYYLMLAAVPLVLWTLFSLWYFGFPFPNTAYAKLPAGIPLIHRIQQGLVYLADSVQRDILTDVVIVSAIGFGAVSRDRFLLLSSAGLPLYIAYLTWIGGDFMAGRFLSVPLLISVMIVGRSCKIWLDSKALSSSHLIYVAIPLFLCAHPVWSNDVVPRDRLKLINEKGIADERLFFSDHSSIASFSKDRHLPDFIWAQTGRVARYQKLAFFMHPNVGMLGFFAGPHVHVLDQMGLADPLLAHLPVNHSRSWRVGHYMRNVPTGYVETLKTGVNQIADPDVRQYYGYLSTMTRGNLWSWQRVQTIVKMNLGLYDSLLRP